MFYFDQRTPLGGWSPCTAPEQPVSTSADGVKRKIRACREIEACFANLNLKQLWAVYSPDGPFYLQNLRTGVSNERRDDN